MNCHNCDEQFAEDSQIFFSYLCEEHTYLLIKPGQEASFDEDKTIVVFDESIGTRQIQCHKCKLNLGKILPFGPSNKYVKAFASTKVKLIYKNHNGQELHNVYSNLPRKNCNTEDYFKASDTKKGTITKKVIKEPINFPQMQTPADFDWSTITLAKNPYDYQIQAFEEGLQKNIVVVLNTGAGKTFIGSMILAKMCQLNPNRMGLMIVEKIPLAFQQGDAVAGDTKLSVISLHGKIKKKARMKKLNRECYDALVVTAGAFYQMLLKNCVDVSLFCTVIFDECHHLSKKNLYVEIMKKFLSQELSHQPRIIGLTASPFAGDNEVKAEKNLKKFIKNFPNAKIYSPILEPALPTTRKELISLSKDQKDFIKAAVDAINQQLVKIAKDFPLENIFLKSNLSNSSQIVGDLRLIQKDYSEKENNKDFMHVLLLIDALELFIYFGIPSACKFLEGEDILEKLPEEFYHVTEISERLQKLESYLKSVNEDSRVLVFVDKRLIAKILTEWIQEHFPGFNAQMVVGQAGYDGMTWKEQKIRINDFAEGKSRLTVSTSVLEEGFDVPQCDLVVAFTGSHSLISFIQMRGRARNQDSVFVTLEAEEHGARTKDVQNQENVMRKVLEAHQKSYFSGLSKH